MTLHTPIGGETVPALQPSCRSAAVLPKLELTRPAKPSPGAASEVAAWQIRRGADIAGIQPIRKPPTALGKDQVRVQMRAVSLNHRDLMLIDGRSGSDGKPLIPTSDGAGVVIEVGSEVRDLRVGDRVCSAFFPDWLSGPPTADKLARVLGGSVDGMLASEVVMAESAWLAIPAHMDYAQASTLSCAGLTAWHALFAAEPLSAGASVLLLGTGGVSVWALQLAKAAGLRVIITSSSQRKLRRAIELGADQTINYRQCADWETEVLRLTDGRGVDRVLEVGGPGTLRRSIASTRIGGSIAVVGRLSGSDPIPLDPAQLFLGLKRLTGVMVGSREMAQALVRFCESHRILPVIDRRFDFAQAADAFAYLQRGDHLGKVVIEIPAALD